jgi:O-antigen ligase
MTRSAGTPNSTLPRGVLGVLTLGAVVTLLAALPYPTFDLERHAVPKELALLVAAGCSGWLLIRRGGALVLGRTEFMLGAYGIWTMLSLVAAERWWPGIRAAGVTVAGLAIFVAASAAARAGRARVLLGVLAIAAALAVGTALAQAYGAESELFSGSRAPGGVFGNRNFMAHAAVVALALLVPAILRAGRAGSLVALATAAALTAGVVMSRSRAAWLAAAAGAVALIAAAWLAGELARGSGGRRRIAALAGALALGAAVAVLVPNRLQWRSDAPYLESLRGVADYRSGSGRGRLVQYRHTLEMVRDHPVTGVGPGNWPVAYPRYTRPGDPAFAAGQPVPTNPWPSSDWVGIAAERGLPALVLLVAAGVLLTARAVSRLGGKPDRRAAAVGGLALLGVVLVIGCFDAQLLLPAPTFLIMGGLGALLPAEKPLLRWSPSEQARGRLAIAIVAMGCVAGGRLAVELTAMHLYERGGERRVLAAKVDPGNYRIRALLARGAADAGRCADARRWAREASARFPDAPFPKAVARRCGGS